MDFLSDWAELGLVVSRIDYLQKSCTAEWSKNMGLTKQFADSLDDALAEQANIVARIGARAGLRSPPFAAPRLHGMPL